MHDDELVSAALGGDGEAFGALVERHRRDALRVAYGIADGEADDVAQDAFVKAYRNLGQFRAGASFRAWLLAIVANEARNRRRSFMRRNALVLRVRDSRPWPVPTTRKRRQCGVRAGRCWPTPWPACPIVTAR